MENALKTFCRQNRGIQSRIADEIGVWPGTVNKWVNRKVPAEQVRAISKVTGLAPSIIRPDLFADNDLKAAE